MSNEKQIDDGGSAFPCPIAIDQNNTPRFSREYGEEGMSLRDYFAARALQGEVQLQGMEGCDKHLICAMAYEMADAMIEARKASK